MENQIVNQLEDKINWLLNTLETMQNNIHALEYKIQELNQENQILKTHKNQYEQNIGDMLQKLGAIDSKFQFSKAEETSDNF